MMIHCHRGHHSKDTSLAILRNICLASIFQWCYPTIPSLGCRYCSPYSASSLKANSTNLRLVLRGGADCEKDSTHLGQNSNPAEEQAVPGLQSQLPNATVTAFEVRGEVDYDRLIENFGCERMTPSLIERIESITGRRVHHLFRRGFFFSHRDLGALLDLYEAGKPFYLYTGRGPSSARMHIGHMVPFIATRWLQEVFNVPVIIQLTDDEKYLWKGGELAVYQRYAVENAKDIIAMGFNENLTYIFTDTSAIEQLYPTVLAIQRHVTYSQVKGIFGFEDGDNIGKHAFPAVQAAPSFSFALPLIFPGKTQVPCLIPCAIDQDPYFRMTRDVAPRLRYRKPALIHSKFIPALQGATGKMSASEAETAIYLSDTPADVKKKINRYAFSGGRATAEEHRQLGGDTSIDVSFRYLEFFVEDDEELAAISAKYRQGTLLSGEMKSLAINCIQQLLGKHQSARAGITEAMLQYYMMPRPLLRHFHSVSSATSPRASQQLPVNVPTADVGPGRQDPLKA